MDLNMYMGRSIYMCVHVIVSLEMCLLSCLLPAAVRDLYAVPRPPPSSARQPVRPSHICRALYCCAAPSPKHHRSDERKMSYTTGSTSSFARPFPGQPRPLRT